MASVKEFIRENKVVVLVFVLTVSIAIGVFIYHQMFPNNPHEKNLTNDDVSDIQYVKKNYQVNEYHNVTIELSDLLNEYYRSYINKLLHSKKDAYEMLTAESKENFGNSYDEFSKYVDKITTIGLADSKVTEYRTNDGRIKSYDIIDSEGNKFTIYEKSIWDLEFSFEGKK